MIWAGGMEAIILTLITMIDSGNEVIISCHLGKIGMEDCIGDLIPFFLGGAIICILVAYIPAISTWLPNLLFN
jgi:TRAP-type C4-dicarboxylate transport system permease large subunit